MMPYGSRLRQTGWIVLLALCAAVFLVLTFHVNSVKNKVHLAERTIIALELEKQTLEIEFEARANQQQLANWNKIDFGYDAPKANQYLDSPRQLAALGLARGPGAPEPIRLARAETEDETTLISMVSPLTGTSDDQEQSSRSDRSNRSSGQSLADRLSRSSGFSGQIAQVTE
ncbi:MAG: hypothetical protein WBH10_08455 [Allopontixanthobacter sediminis]